MARMIRPQFDAACEFVVNKPMKVQGAPLQIGDPFDKTSVNLRRLRQLYDSRWIKYAEASSGPATRPRKHRHIDNPTELPKKIMRVRLGLR